MFTIHPAPACTRRRYGWITAPRCVAALRPDCGLSKPGSIAARVFLGALGPVDLGPRMGQPADAAVHSADGLVGDAGQRMIHE